jgi:hypothetical protein
MLAAMSVQRNANSAKRLTCQSFLPNLKPLARIRRPIQPPTAYPSEEAIITIHAYWIAPGSGQIRGTPRKFNGEISSRK